VGDDLGCGPRAVPPGMGERHPLGPSVEPPGGVLVAGVLYGLSKGMPLADAGRLGSLAASEVISHVGPRPNRPLSDFL